MNWYCKLLHTQNTVGMWYYFKYIKMLQNGKINIWNCAKWLLEFFFLSACDCQPQVTFLRQLMESPAPSVLSRLFTRQASYSNLHATSNSPVQLAVPPVPHSASSRLQRTQTSASHAPLTLDSASPNLLSPFLPPPTAGNPTGINPVQKETFPGHPDINGASHHAQEEDWKRFRSGFMRWINNALSDKFNHVKLSSATGMGRGKRLICVEELTELLRYTCIFH